MAYFSDKELRCKCGCGQVGVTDEFRAMLEELRERVGFPLLVSSGYRCPSYNKRFGSTPAHEKGVAVDLLVSGARAHKVLKEALSMGFTGIGVAQKGDRAGRFIHLDILPVVGYPRPAIWSY